MINVPHEAGLVFTTAGSGVVCVVGYLLAFALGRRLHAGARRPMIGLGELFRPLGCGMLTGVAILFCELSGNPDDPGFQSAPDGTLSVLLMVGLVGLGAGGWAARRRAGEASILASDLVSRLCVAGDTREDATARIAVRLALAAGYDPSRASDLMVAASLHDIGKVGIDGGILTRSAHRTGVSAGGLSGAERHALQSHTSIGFRMLARSHEPMLDLAAEIALHHHENWDGSGYPRGLAGEKIPLASRVVALAESFDELLGDNCDVVRMERAMRFGAGKQFDPRLVSLLLADLPGMIGARGAQAASDCRHTEELLAAWLEPGRFRPVQSRHIAI